MTPLLERLQVRATGIQTRLNQSPVVEVETHLTGAIRHIEFGISKEYSMRLNLEVVFWANDAMYAHVRSRSEKLLMALLYEDALCTLAALDAALANRDLESADELVYKLREKMSP